MEAQKYLEKRQYLQVNLIKYIDEEDDNDNFLTYLENIFKDQKTLENKDEMTELFHLLISIANNHHRSACFFLKIDRILKLFKNEILHFFQQNEIFKIFKSNKRILFLLFEEKIVTADKYIADYMINKINKNDQYPSYFYHEIKQFIDEKFELQKDVNFEMNRKNGENDNYICYLIRNDLIDEFVIFTNQSCQPLTSQITSSVFETNSFLIEKNKSSLIEYSAFFGSVQIFKYLYLNNVELSPSLWIYAIHGRNQEILYILEENHIKPKDKTFNECLIEAIKCHHNEIADYISNNLLIEQNDRELKISKCFEYFNYAYFPNDLENAIILYNSCKYDYISLVKILLQKQNININSKINEIYIYIYINEILIVIIFHSILMYFHSIFIGDLYSFNFSFICLITQY